MNSFLNIILPLLLLSNVCMFDDAETIFRPSRGFGKRSPVIQEEGIPDLITRKWILPTGIQRRIIKILKNDETCGHRMNIFLLLVMPLGALILFLAFLYKRTREQRN